MDDILIYKNIPVIVLDSYSSVEEIDTRGNIQYKVLFGTKIIWLYKEYESNEILIEDEDIEYINRYWKKNYI